LTGPHRTSPRRLLAAVATETLLVLLITGCSDQGTGPVAEPSTPALTSPTVDPEQARELAEANCRAYEKIARSTRRLHHRWFSGEAIRYSEFTYEYGSSHQALVRLPKAPSHSRVNAAFRGVARAYVRAKRDIAALGLAKYDRRIRAWDKADAKVHRLCLNLEESPDDRRPSGTGSA
jgi:hypothetical protein